MIPQHSPWFYLTIFLIAAAFNLVTWAIALDISQIPSLRKTAERRRLGFIFVDIALQAIFFYFYVNELKEQAIIPAASITVLVTLLTLSLTKFCPRCGEVKISLRGDKLCKKCIGMPIIDRKLSSFQLRLMGIPMLVIGIIMLFFLPINYVPNYLSTTFALLLGGLYFLIHG